jgi:hypothetical protein
MLANSVIGGYVAKKMVENGMEMTSPSMALRHWKS